ncbi:MULTISPECIES: hypothetical protein [unclassified Mesotoga]|uniref:hypothetical protein n=1 Tax=unclassified Mesotoga TaxID=1184398 RepID=UPI000DA66CE0|nr:MULTISPECIES: hypothetical protein [unclassified Mesotoga]
MLTGEEAPPAEEEAMFNSLQKAIGGASKLKIQQNDVNSLMISSNNVDNRSEKRSKLSDLEDKGSKYKEENAEQIEEWKKEFKENQEISNICRRYTKAWKPLSPFWSNFRTAMNRAP